MSSEHYFTLKFKLPFDLDIDDDADTHTKIENGLALNCAAAIPNVGDRLTFEFERRQGRRTCAPENMYRGEEFLVFEVERRICLTKQGLRRVIVTVHLEFA